MKELFAPTVEVETHDSALQDGTTITLKAADIVVTPLVKIMGNAMLRGLGEELVGPPETYGMGLPEAKPVTSQPRQPKAILQLVANQARQLHSLRAELQAMRQPVPQPFPPAASIA